MPLGLPLAIPGASALLDRVDAGLRALDAQGLRRRRRLADGPCAPRQHVDGRAMLAFASNDYLGLAGHARLRDALIEGVRLDGVGSGASPLISGHGRAHARAEDCLAAFSGGFVDAPRALHFCTGYMANLAVLTALAALAPGRTAIFSEQLNHASLIDGARLARASLTVYPHRDVATLEQQLRASQSGSESGNKSGSNADSALRIIVTDSVFSMDGALAPLPDLLALAERHDAWLVVDDAHGFGLLGHQGRGALDHFGLRSERLVYVGTLGKAAGVAGAFVAAHASVIEWLVQRARTYIFSTAAPPALAHAVCASVDLIAGAEGDARRARLAALVTQLRGALAPRRWTLMDSDCAIQPLVIGANAATLAAAAALEARNIRVPAIRPPTVPDGTARLRITLSAAHAPQDVDRLVEALHGVEQAQEHQDAPSGAHR